MKLADARGGKGLSVRKLADLAGVAPATVYHLEHGRGVPSFRSIRDISAALGLDPLEIEEFAAVIEGTGAGKAGSTPRSPSSASSSTSAPASWRPSGAEQTSSSSSRSSGSRP